MAFGFDPLGSPSRIIVSTNLGVLLDQTTSTRVEIELIIPIGSTQLIRRVEAPMFNSMFFNIYSVILE